MTVKHADRRILKLAVAGALPVLALALGASAQVASGNNGRALDANNRLGSGGINGANSSGAGVTPNQIIYGNVTGGKGFTGPIGSRDSTAFFGPTSGGISDRFIAGSSGVPQPYQPSIDLSKTQAFYGNDRNVAPPLGSVRVGYTGAYLGTSVSDSPLMQNPLASPFAQEKQQLGTVSILGTKTTVSGNDFGEQLFQTSLSNDLPQTTFSGSALYGIQSLNSGMDNTLGLGNPANPNDRFQFQNAEERRMRQELQQPGSNPNDLSQKNNNGTNNNNGNNPDQTQNNGQNNSLNPQPLQPNNIQQPLESIDNSAFGDRAGKSPTNQALSNGLQTGGSGTQQRFTLVTPEMQSTQYSELKKRLERYQTPQQIATEQQVQNNRERRAATDKTSVGPTSRQAQSGTPYIPRAVRTTPDAATPQPNPGKPAPATPENPQPTVTPAIPSTPMKVNSLADGVNARGLHELLATGESLMHDGKFQSAIDRYNTAGRIAPNNPLVPIGLATAQLGAGAFRNASDTLHDVFITAEPTLMAQYNLGAWLPADRLDAIKTQLGELSAKEKADETPEFLLAYIAYNTGDSTAAKEHLDEARKRSGGKDKVLDRLQTDWQLQAAKPAPMDLNK